MQLQLTTELYRFITVLVAAARFILGFSRWQVRHPIPAASGIE